VVYHGERAPLYRVMYHGERAPLYRVMYLLRMNDDFCNRLKDHFSILNKVSSTASKHNLYLKYW